MTGILLALTALHDVDHVRQGRDLGLELYGVAVLAIGTTTAVLLLLRRRHPVSTIAAIVLGLVTVVGVSVVHVAPQRAFLSDPYAAADADALSWVVIVLMMIVGVGMAAVGLSSGFRRRPLRG